MHNARLRHAYSRLLFFFTDPPTTEISTLSLHDALPICLNGSAGVEDHDFVGEIEGELDVLLDQKNRLTLELQRSEEHTSELQSRLHLVCRLLLEKKKKNHI